MILQEEFYKCGYHDLLSDEDTSRFGIDLEDLYDPAEKPGELLGIFISEHRDELFFLLRGDKQDVKSLCKQWDERIRIFAIINGNNDAFKKLKYNIVQLIVFSGADPDRSREVDLQITRKIIIKGDLTDQDHIVIEADNAVDLPFWMITSDAFSADEQLLKQLGALLPKETKLLTILKEPRRRMNRRTSDEPQIKNFTKTDYATIKEWLER